MKKGNKSVSKRIVFITLVVVFFAVAVYAAAYTRPLIKLNGVNGTSNQCVVSSPTVPSGAAIKGVKITGTRTFAPTNVPLTSCTWHIEHIASGMVAQVAFNANGATTNAFNGLPAATQWRVWFTYTPTTSTVTISNGKLEVTY